MRRLLVWLTALLCLLGAVPAAQGLTRHRQTPPPPPTVPTPPPLPKAWIVVDQDTGAVIEAGNGHQPMLPASVSKIVTALVAVQQLQPVGRRGQP